MKRFSGISGMIRASVLVLGMGLALPALADDSAKGQDEEQHARQVCEKYGDGEKAVASARKIAAGCDKVKPGEKKADCYELPIDIVFHCSGDYRVTNDFLNRQYAALSGTQNAPRKVAILSVLSYYTYSIEVNDLLDKKLRDFTMAPVEQFLKREASFSGNYQFYNNAADVPLLILTHHQFGSEPTKRSYYKVLKRLYGRMNELWPTQVEANRKKMPADEYDALVLQRRALGKVLSRFREKYDE